MPVSDYQLIEAWKEVLTLSRLEARADRHDPDECGHPSADALVRAHRHAVDGRDRQPSRSAARQRRKGVQPRLARVSRHHAADRQPRRDRGAQGERSRARSDDTAVLARAARHPQDRHEDPAGGRAARSARAPGADAGRPQRVLAATKRIGRGAGDARDIAQPAPIAASARSASSDRLRNTASSTSRAAGTIGRAASR